SSLCLPGVRTSDPCHLTRFRSTRFQGKTGALASFRGDYFSSSSLSPSSASLRLAPLVALFSSRITPFWFSSAVTSFPLAAVAPRSEEHTSELQSLTNLVCRLLLEKKK